MTTTNERPKLTTPAELQGCTGRRFKYITHPTLTLPGGVPITLRIRSLNEREKTEYDNTPLNASGDWKRDKAGAARRRLITLCSVDEEGSPNMSEADLAWMDEIDGAITDWAFLECRDHCNLRSVVDEAKKNLSATGGSSSSSGSPPTSGK